MKLILLPKYKAMDGGGGGRGFLPTTNCSETHAHTRTTNTRAVYRPGGAWRNVLNPTIIEDVISFPGLVLLLNCVDSNSNVPLHYTGGEQRRR